MVFGKNKYYILAVVQLMVFENVISHMIGNNPYHQVEWLDTQETYKLEWFRDLSKSIVTFTVTVETQGFIIFGLSKNGTFSGADLIVGGVTSNGRTYFSDRFGVSQDRSVVDSSQDWRLHSASENGTHTILTFSRLLDTGNTQDYAITDNKISLIWGYGSRDDENGGRIQTRGVYEVYLLRPNYVPELTRDKTGKVNGVVGDITLGDLKTWSIPKKMTIPSNHTTYWCTVVPALNLPRKHHVVGFEARFEPPEMAKHVHHLDIKKCHPPPGTSAREMYEPFVNHPGQTCFSPVVPTGPIQIQHCSMFLGANGIGGRTFFLPPHVGLPVNPFDDDGYYILQVHYDNPEELVGLNVETHLDFFYTSNLREHDGGLILFGSPYPSLPPNILIPPKTSAHTVNAHCGPECTRKMLPESGINFIGGLLHSHNTGKMISLKHFRGGRELPTMMSDNNFNSRYQQFSVVQKEVKILPGDQITPECVYDNTLTNGTVVGGLSTKQEMCIVFAYYYNLLEDYSVCLSELGSESETVREQFLGVTNVTWFDSNLEYVVQPPESLAGLTISQVSDFHVDWTPSKREEFARVIRYHPQMNYCPGATSSSGNEEGFTVAYPASGRDCQGDENEKCLSENYGFPPTTPPPKRKSTFGRWNSFRGGKGWTGIHL